MGDTNNTDKAAGDVGAPLVLDKGEKKFFLLMLNAGLVVLNLGFLGMLIGACAAARPSNAAIWFLLVAAAAGSGVGNIAGFVYASYGRETERFKSITNLINGFIGGASIADLSRGNASILVKAFQSVGRSCGLQSGGALVAILAAAFASLGFISMYCNRKLLFNSLMAEQDKFLKDLGEEVDATASAPISAPSTPPGPSGRAADRPSLPVSVEEAATEVAKMPFEQLKKSPKGVIAWSKAKLNDGSYVDAARGFSEALKASGDDPELRLGYGLALFYSGFRKDAFRELETAMRKVTEKTDREVVKNIIKALTYCCLYLPGGYEAAIQYGEEYVANPSLPVSGGIFVNLAAAYGQQYAAIIERNPDVKSAPAREARAKTLRYMKKAIVLDGSWITTFRMLLVRDFRGKSPEENDLEAFEHDRRFRTILLLPVTDEMGPRSNSVAHGIETS